MALTMKYAPQSISDIAYNRDIMNRLMHLATYDDLPHIIITGQPGSGKKTLVYRFLQLIYDEGVNTLRSVSYNIPPPSKSTTKIKSKTGGGKEVVVCESRYHLVFEPAKSNNEKHTLQEIIKQYASYDSLGVFKTNRPFKTILIYDIDKLTDNTQAALRRTMEQYAEKCRFIMVCNNLSAIIDPLRSRCSIFNIEKPSKKIIEKHINKIAINEGMDLDDGILDEICGGYDTNMERAMWTLDCLRLGCDPVLDIDKSYELAVNLMLTYRNNFIGIYYFEVRQLLYNILITGIPVPEIIRKIVDLLIDRIDDDETIHKIIEAGSKEYNYAHGRRDIMHCDWPVWLIIKALTEMPK